MEQSIVGQAKHLINKTLSVIKDINFSLGHYCQYMCQKQKRSRLKLFYF